MFSTVVLALDGSESSDRALEFATTLAKEQGSAVCVVHVREIFVGRGGGPMPLNESDLQAKVERQVKELTDAGVKTEFQTQSVPYGGPAHVIADAAENAKADVVIVGTRGHGGIAGALLGSVAHRLLHLAHCPVLVVPPPA
jgi:nucleotide-binding universal stress UspA family protein